MEKRFLSFPEAAAFLGLSRSKVEKLVGQEKIPSYKIDKRRVFDKEELVEWVKSHRDDTQADFKQVEARHTPKKKRGRKKGESPS